MSGGYGGGDGGGGDGGGDGGGKGGGDGGGGEGGGDGDCASLRPSVIQVEKNPKQLRKQIRIAILNYQAIGGALFTPDKAFDSIAKKEIEKLRKPATDTVDLTIQG